MEIFMFGYADELRLGCASVRIALGESGEKWLFRNPARSPMAAMSCSMSSADNLVAGDTNGKYDIFLKDTQTGAITLLSTDANGGLGNGDSFAPSLSADGRYVVFHSRASNLVSGDTNGSHRHLSQRYADRRNYPREYG